MMHRRFSRQTSRTPMDEQNNFDALLVDSEETSDFPWLNTIIEMNKSINFLCVHSTGQCPEYCPIEQINSCNSLIRALKVLFEHKLDNEDMDTMRIGSKAKKNDLVFDYVLNQVCSCH